MLERRLLWNREFDSSRPSQKSFLINSIFMTFRESPALYNFSSNGGALERIHLVVSLLAFLPITVALAPLRPARPRAHRDEFDGPLNRSLLKGA
jgi:hypothetical protein